MRNNCNEVPASCSNLNYKTLPMKYLYIFLLIGIQCVAQNQNKKVYYYDENWLPITEQSFKKVEADRSLITRHFDIDTAYVAKIFLFENYGKLESKHFNAIKKRLENLSGNKLDTSKTIVINYISAVEPLSINPENGKVNIYDTSKWKDYKQLKKRTDINLLWLQHPDNSLYIGRYNKDVNWIFDKDDYIAKTFLEHNCHIGSLILIKPDGSYLAFYCIEKASGEINDIIDKFKNNL